MLGNELLRHLQYKKYAFTGANGFLGGNAAKQVLEQPGTKVIALTRPDSDNSRIKLLRKQFPGRITIIPCDTSKLELKIKDAANSISSALDGVDAFFHFAGVPKLANSISVADLVQRINTDGTKNIIKLIMLMRKPPLFAGIGSLFETGIVNSIIYEDKRYGAQFRNPYESSKWKAADFTRNLFEKGKLNGYWFRPAIITGESKTGAGSENGNLKGPAVLSAIAAMRKKNSVRYALNSKVGLPFLHVDYVNAAILHIVSERKAPNGTCFHLFSEKAVQIKELVDITEDIVNRKRKENSELWGGPEKFSIACDCIDGVTKPSELMAYAGPNASVISYNIDNTNARRFLAPELLNPPIDISICLQYVINRFEKKRINNSDLTDNS
ncbi:MAG: NAD-dependent epimerase/dehydratase family protein [Desulfobacteraceae bacterium]|nr:NAD-dependent epimerase/dehydratase family protein [Desulfobacteraceae bacterium]